MRAHQKDADLDGIISDIPKGNRSRKPTEKHYYTQCPTFGLGDCTKKFCVAKKWFDLCPPNSDGTSNHMSVHWYSHFKVLYDTKEILHLVLNIADNQLRNLYCHHILKHGGNNFPYFDYDEKNRRSDRIKADENAKRLGNARNLTDIKSDTKSRRDAENQSQPDMSVLSVIF